MDQASRLRQLQEMGADDWIHILDVIEIVQEDSGSDPAHVREEALRLIRAALNSGIAEVGCIDAGVFRPWNLSTNESIQKISREWTLDFEILPGHIFWLRTVK